MEGSNLLKPGAPPARLALHRAGRQVRVDGSPVALGSRAFDLLWVLAEQQPRVVPLAELLDLAWPGVVVEPGNVHVQINAIRRLLGRDAVVTSAGRGYQLAVPADLSWQAPAATDDDAALAAPEPEPPIVGRDAELQALGDWLQHERMVTLTGPGGCGKTRLARELHRRCAATRPVAWLDLAALSPGDDLLPPLARALALPLPAGAPVAALARWRGLLVLDNAEHVAAAAGALLADLLPLAPGLQVLATSQQPLRVPGERLWPLDMLALPAAGSPPAQARGTAALALLLRQAARTAPAYRLADVGLGAAIALCQALDGRPLAIEMAAPWLPRIGAAALLQRLASGGDSAAGLLVAPQQPTAARHASLQAAVQWSYGLLDSAQQRALQRLSVLHGAFDLAVAGALLQPAGSDAADSAAYPLLAALVDLSVLQMQGSPPRYRLLDTVRSFALAKARGSGQLRAAQDAHLRAQVLAATQVRDDFRRLSHVQVRQRHGHRVRDLQAAFDHAAHTRNAAAGAPVAMALTYLDYAFSVFAGATRRVQQVLQLLADAHESADIALLWKVVQSSPDPTASGLPCTELLRRCADAWRDAGDAIEQMAALSQLAQVLAERGEAAAAEAVAAQAATLRSDEHPLRVQFIVEEMRALLDAQAGRVADARRQLARWHLAAVGSGDTRDAHALASQLLELAALDGDAAAQLPQAAALAAQAQALQQPSLHGLALWRLALVQGLCGQLPAARDSARQAADRLRESGRTERLPELAAWLGALAGRAEQAAMVLGLCDHRLQAATAWPRAWATQRVHARAWAHLQSTLDEATLQFLHRRGAQIPVDDLPRLVDELLAEPGG